MLIVPVPTPDALKQLKAVDEASLRRVETVKDIDDYAKLFGYMFHQFDFFSIFQFAYIIKTPRTVGAWKALGHMRWDISRNEDYVILVGTITDFVDMVHTFLCEPYSEEVGDTFYRQMNQLCLELEGIKKTAFEPWIKKTIHLDGYSTDIFILEYR